LLGTTLDAVHVIIHVEESDSEGEAGHDDTVHLAGGPRVGGDDRDEHDLDDRKLGKLGKLRHLEALLHSVNLLSGGRGIGFHSLAVTGHFYYLSRK